MPLAVKVLPVFSTVPMPLSVWVAPSVKSAVVTLNLAVEEVRFTPLLLVIEPVAPSARVPSETVVSPL
jgi:hypothetical protein